MEEKYYGIVRWMAEDLTGIAEEKGVQMSREEAEAWWQKHERAFKESLTAVGNEILEDMLVDDDVIADRLAKVVPATYMLEWDDGKETHHIETPCQVNLETKRVFDIEDYPDIDWTMICDESIRFVENGENQIEDVYSPTACTELDIIPGEVYYRDFD